MQSFIARIATLQWLHRCRIAQNHLKKLTYHIGMKIALSDTMVKTVAITVWNDIVSPFYDASCCLEIIRPDNIRKIINVRNMSLYEKADCCRKEGVAVVMCGAISTIGKATLQDNSIEVLSWLRGPVKDILNVYNNNGIIPEQYAMPGYRQSSCGRRQYRNRGGCCRI